MMDMGFWPDVRRIIAALPATRQTLLFSATMPNEVVKDALEICKEPKYIQVGQRSAAAKTISHSKAEVSHGHKADWLIEHLRKPEGPVLIFSRTKIGADKLARKLQSAGIRCVALHADRTMTAAAGGRRVPRREIPRARRHRHRGPRTRHRRHSYRHQLRSTRFS